MSDHDPSPNAGSSQSQRRPGWRFLSLVLVLVLSLNFVMPGGLGAIASVLPDNSSTGSTQLQESSPGPSTTVTGDRSRADIAETANPAVVTVYSRTQFDNPFGEENSQVFPGGGTTNEATSIGSGFIIDTEGHVVTNSHVVTGGEEYVVEFFDGTTATATLVGQDSVQDIAVLKLDLEDGQTVPGTLIFGDSDTVRPGDDVIAIGTPLGEFANSVSAGVVGGVDRSLSDITGSIDNLIQHDAPISSGNSGGPLLNENGEVIGVNVAAATGSQLTSVTTDGLGFAIASNAAKAIVDELIANGKISRPYLGIEGQPLETGHGVVSVEADSPAADAGLERGDIIIAIDGDPIDADQSLQSLLYVHKPGDDVTLTVQRDNEEATLQVTLGERPSDVQ